MFLIAGLGNPGARYAATRHNVGRCAAERIAAHHGFGAWRSRFHGLCARGSIAGRAVMIVLPETFMNDSGRAVGEAVRYFAIPPEKVIAIHDELDLPVCKIRVKSGGGHAGHNGVRSLIAHIGAGFRRVRIGIGRPGRGGESADYVLKPFAREEERSWVVPLLDALAQESGLLISGRDTDFMNRLAHRVLPAETAGTAERAEGKMSP